MAPLTRNLVLAGTFIHSKTRKELEFLHDAAVGVDTKGIIVAIERGDGDVKQAQAKLLKTLGWAEDEVDVQASKPGQFFFPGFIGELSNERYAMVLSRHADYR